MKEIQREATRSEAREQALHEAKGKLVELGKQKGVLTYTEIVKRLGAFELDPDQLDEFFDLLSEQSVDVLNTRDDDEEDEEDVVDEAEEEEADPG